MVTCHLEVMVEVVAFISAQHATFQTPYSTEASFQTAAGEASAPTSGTHTTHRSFSTPSTSAALPRPARLHSIVPSPVAGRPSSLCWILSSTSSP
jgi:hypothetical protein